MFRPYVNFFFISVVTVRVIRFTCFNNDDNNDFFIYLYRCCNIGKINFPHYTRYYYYF